MLSFLENAPVIVNFAANQFVDGIESICDVGCGMGKYGLLIKERYLSMMAELYITPRWDKKLIAVEDNMWFWQNSAIDEIYDDSFWDDAFDTLPDAEMYLFIDIAEHHSKEKFFELVNSLHGKTVLVSTPRNTVMYTEHYYGDARHHITQYLESDFSEWRHNLSTDLSLIYATRIQ